MLGPLYRTFLDFAPHTLQILPLLSQFEERGLLLLTRRRFDTYIAQKRKDS